MNSLQKSSLAYWIGNWSLSMGFGVVFGLGVGFFAFGLGGLGYAMMVYLEGDRRT